jgi:hypothetical protein
MNAKNLFFELYNASSEDEVEKVISKNSSIFTKSENWRPLGGNENNFGVIENQQSSPIAALIEKVTNSIDALLMKKCYEDNIDPKSQDAPRSMEAAKNEFSDRSKDWDLTGSRQAQTENKFIQQIEF